MSNETASRLAKSLISTQDQQKISDLNSSFEDTVKDFERAIDVETLKTVRNMEENMLLNRLQPLQTGYSLDRCCMQETRISLLDEIAKWASRPVDQARTLAESIYWLYGIPGIGKTAMAHSICARLHLEGRLGGSFFCRRDDLKFSDPTYVLPTLVCKLAETWSPYRKLVAEKLRKDPHLTQNSAGVELLSQLLELLRDHPHHPLVLIIDAFDECGDIQGRKSILTSLMAASSQVTWLKIIITSRQEHDIESFFKRPDCVGRYVSKDLATEDSANEDIRAFAKAKLSLIANYCGLPEDWPGNDRLTRVVTRSGGLFIFVETLWRLLQEGLDRNQTLDQALSGDSTDALEGLYALYSTAIGTQTGRHKEIFRSAMGTIIVVGQYQPLPDESIAKLTGLGTDVVMTLVNKLGPLLYRDAGEHGGIRVRHLSVIDFLTGTGSPQELRVDTDRANREVGIACLRIMIKGLKFNICDLESSFCLNQDVVDLETRVQERIPNPLRYSCLYWSDHVCHTVDTADPEIYTALGNFADDCRLLYWIEALSLLKKIPLGESALRRLLQWIKVAHTPSTRRISDVLRFLFMFREPIVTSTPHIYVSGLAFMPTDTDLWGGVKERFENILKMEGGRLKGWPAHPNALIGHTETVTSVKYSPDGRYIVSGSNDQTIRIWDVETGAGVGKSLEGHRDGITSVACSPDGRYIVSGSEDRTIRIWDVERGAAVGKPLEGHRDGITSVAYSPDGRYIVSGSEDQTIRIWDVEKGAAVGKPLEGHSREITSVAYSPDGRYIVSGSKDRTIRIWDVESGAAVGKPLEGRGDWITSVAYSPDGRYIVSGSYDRTIRIWDVESGAAVGKPLEGHNSGIMSVAYSPDGRYIVSGSNDQTIRIWDVERGAAVGKPLEGHNSGITSIAYSPDGRYIVSGSEDRTIRIWDVESGAAVGKLLEGRGDWIKSVAYSPDGRYIVSGSYDRTIRIWDVESGAAVGKPLEGHGDWITSIAYSPNECYAVSGSHDQTIRIWCPTNLNSINGRCFSPDRNGWVHHPQGGLWFWVPEDCRNGLACPAILTIPTSGSSRVVRVDPDGFCFGPSWTDIKTTDLGARTLPL